jgi:hypothetical protein
MPDIKFNDTNTNTREALILSLIDAGIEPGAMVNAVAQGNTKCHESSLLAVSQIKVTKSYLNK